MTGRLRLVVLGTLASNPYAGMAWMHMQIAAGLRRLGHEVWYLEATSAWPFDPVRNVKVCDDEYAVPYLARVAERFGFGERWACRRSFGDGEWLGPAADEAPALLRDADAVFNVAGATTPEETGEEIGRAVFLETDPVFPEILYAQGDEKTRTTVDAHADVVTYGENIGTERSPVPPLPRLRTRMRQPVLLDLWRNGAASRQAYTTVGNWHQSGCEVVFDGELYHWSKDREFKRILDLPGRVPAPLELATNLGDGRVDAPIVGEAVPAHSVEEQDRLLLLAHGWQLVDARPLSTSPDPYRDYIVSSRGELTVARDLNVRLRSGWFSERSACYLAAGRPVISQDTGFGDVLPTGEGLLAFSSEDEAATAIEAVESDYERHSAAAAEIAAEFFRAETVLAAVLDALA